MPITLNSKPLEAILWPLKGFDIKPSGYDFLQQLSQQKFLIFSFIIRM